MKKVDLNCDLGESFGNYKLGMDEQILPLITSANIACGFHASDPVVMSRTVKMAAESGVAAGAHPGKYESCAGRSDRHCYVSDRCTGSILPGEWNCYAACKTPWSHV